MQNCNFANIEICLHGSRRRRYTAEAGASASQSPGSPSLVMRAFTEGTITSTIIIINITIITIIIITITIIIPTIFRLNKDEIVPISVVCM